MKGLTESMVMVAAVLLATAWSAGPAAASMVDRVSTLVRASVDQTRLPLGDGKVSSSPQVGYVFSCQSSFNGRGSPVNGPWMHNDGTWDATAKVSVDGAVSWPHQFTVSVDGGTRTLTGNDLPDHITGVFPVAAGDDAARYDPNPNSIKAQSIRYSLPANPTLASQPTCAPGGPIGVMLTGSIFFNALDALGRDAVVHEVQDTCGGHPEMTGQYHYHNLPACLDDGGSGHSALVGYALDGFGIYGHRGEDGSDLTDADLDACHGHTHEIEWDGQKVVMYHYHATWEYPYTIGCFRGTPAVRANAGPPNQGQQTQGQQAPGLLPLGGPMQGPPAQGQQTQGFGPPGFLPQGQQSQDLGPQGSPMQVPPLQGPPPNGLPWPPPPPPRW